MKRILFIALFLLVTLCCSAQQLVLTQSGFRSSENSECEYVRIVSKNDDMDKEDLYEHCIKELVGSAFMSYNYEKVEDESITLYGYISRSSYIVFGATTLRCIITFVFEDGSVSVKSSVTKENGKELVYDRIFNKKGKVILPSVKNKLEEDINGIIKLVLMRVANMN